MAPYSLRMIQNNNKEILWFWLIVLIVTPIRPYKASSGQKTHKDKGFLMCPCLYGPNPHSPISDCVGTTVGQKMSEIILLVYSICTIQNDTGHNNLFIKYRLLIMPILILHSTIHFIPVNLLFVVIHFHCCPVFFATGFRQNRGYCAGPWTS